MAIFAFPQINNAKPDNTGQLEIGHPLSKGMVGGWMMGQPNIYAQNIVTGQVGRISAILNNTGHTLAPTPFYRAATFVGNSGTGGVSAGVQPQLKVSFPFSVSAAFKPNAFVVNSLIAGNDVAPATAFFSGFTLYFTSGSKLRMLLGNNTSTASTGYSFKENTTTLVAGTWYHVTVVCRSLTDMSIYLNGKDDGGSYTGTGSSLVYTTTGEMRFGRSPTLNGTGMNGWVSHVYIYNEALTESDARALYINPYAMIAPPSVRRYVSSLPVTNTNNSFLFSAMR